MRSGTLVAAASTFLTGCAFGDGDAFGVVEATLAADYEPIPERDEGAGFEKTSADYHVRITELVLSVDALDLTLASTLASSSAAFDPMNPPEGYGLCHNGHCHRDDGALVSYEDIEAELAGQSGDGATTYALAGGDVDSVSKQPLAFGCTGQCTLDRGVIRVVGLTLAAVTATGQVRDGRTGELRRFEGTRPFEVTASLDELEEGDSAPGSFVLPVEIVVDESEPKRIALRLSLKPSVRIFDGVDFSAGAEGSGALVFSGAAGAAARQEIANNVGELDLELDVERSE